LISRTNSGRDLLVAEEIVQRVQEALGNSWLPKIYRESVLPTRTRSYEFPALSARALPLIQQTLLGTELKIGRRRILCPDLATARYLAVFVRIGCQAVAIPYDITRIPHLADELESSWHRMLLSADSLTGARSQAFRARVRGQLIVKVRTEVTDAGAGPKRPEFKLNTRQGRR